ncbi:unnamed protein product [Miscanthus lutarioriparius]|uniref:Uncharacterized protein n=1 Tax=Miscanthus lutarioriparius TaxID=422564 RepID=A0A811Q0M2_9POAL|nr:unnamed protein product [Miscanthus lutarioriparius]
MAASPEVFLADLGEPFSPSIFLDLTAMPRPDCNGKGKDLASDNLGLPFIERILMEEGINDEVFYQYPDHPALQQAQESYRRVLSDATADSCSDGSPTMSVSSGSDAGVGADDLTTDASTTSEQFGDAGVRSDESPARLGDAGVRSDTAAEEEMEKKANRTMLAMRRW